MRFADKKLEDVLEIQPSLRKKTKIKSGKKIMEQIQIIGESTPDAVPAMDDTSSMNLENLTQKIALEFHIKGAERVPVNTQNTVRDLGTSEVGDLKNHLTLDLSSNGAFKSRNTRGEMFLTGRQHLRKTENRSFQPKSNRSHGRSIKDKLKFKLDQMHDRSFTNKLQKNAVKCSTFKLDTSFLKLIDSFLNSQEKGHFFDKYSVASLKDIIGTGRTEIIKINTLGNSIQNFINFADGNLEKRKGLLATQAYQEPALANTGSYADCISMNNNESKFPRLHLESRHDAPPKNALFKDSKGSIAQEGHFLRKSTLMNYISTLNYNKLLSSTLSKRNDLFTKGKPAGQKGRFAGKASSKDSYYSLERRNKFKNKNNCSVGDCLNGISAGDLSCEREGLSMGIGYQLKTEIVKVRQQANLPKGGSLEQLAGDSGRDFLAKKKISRDVGARGIGEGELHPIELCAEDLIVSDRGICKEEYSTEYRNKYKKFDRVKGTYRTGTLTQRERNDIETDRRLGKFIDGIDSLEDLGNKKTSGYNMILS
jgi:hypothetical protein